MHQLENAQIRKVTKFVKNTVTQRASHAKCELYIYTYMYLSTYLLNCFVL